MVVSPMWCGPWNIRLGRRLSMFEFPAPAHLRLLPSHFPIMHSRIRTVQREAPDLFLMSGCGGWSLAID